MKTEQRDPAKLRLHKLHILPAPDETTTEWYSFSDNLQAAGPEKCPPIIINDHGFVMDGWRRVLVARARQWAEIPCVVRPDDEAALIIVESLFGQRDMSRGAKVYFTLPLLEDYTVAAEKRRLSNLRQNRKTNEKPLILPKCSDCTSEDDAASIAERLGVGLRTFFQAKELRQTLHDPRCSWLAEQSGLKAGSADLVKLQASLRAEFEPQLVSGEKGLWFVNSAIAGRLTTADKERNAGDAAQLDFWAGHLHPLMSAVQTWKKVPREVRQRVINDLRGLLRRLPEDDRTAILEGLESAR